MYPTSYGYFYSTASQEIYSSYQMEYLFGIETATTDITILNLLGYYPVVDSSPNFDLNLYTTTSVWTLVPISGGEGATLVWTAVPKPLPVAKVNARAEASQASDTSVSNVIISNYLTSDVLASVASQDLVDRPASLQVVLDETVVLTNALGVTLDAIAAATTVDEINNIVNPPTGIINIGRGDGIGGPEDLNLSYIVELNSVSLTPSQTSLFIPGTSTTVAYDSGLPSPYMFNATFGAFNPGDYTLQIRVTATSQVIATIVVPFGANQNISF